MIVYTIKKEAPIYRSPSFPVAPSRVVTTRCPWDKITYSKWLETVRQTFNEGDKVTLAVCKPTINVNPPVYEIKYINELHYTANWDDHYGEPQCLHLYSEYGLWMYRPPSSVRKLTQEEEERAYLRYLQKQGV